MKMLYGSLLGIVLALIVVPLAAAKPPSWDKQINTPGRFVVLGAFAGAAVLDKETGLVWEQSPETAPNPTTAQTWPTARVTCNTRTVGGRLGWRLSTLQELASLVDPNNPGGNPDLPPGHPFSNVQSSFYWSASTDADFASHALGVGFDFGGVDTRNKDNTNHVWCVSGGQGVDPQ